MRASQDDRQGMRRKAASGNASAVILRGPRRCAQVEMPVVWCAGASGM